ncbi:hypothetical protein D9M72_423450 [compost metagenome]
MVAEHAAENRADDEADAEHGVEQAEALRTLVLGRDVGEVGGCDRHVGARQPGDRTARKEHPEIGRKGEEQIVDRSTRERDQEHGPAAQPIAERTQHRRADELHDRVERGHRADIGRHVVGMDHVLQQRRQDGKDEADAHGIEHNGSKNDDEGFLHDAFRSTQARPRQEAPMPCDWVT